MAFEIFKEIDRLINERGSAAILRERIALLQDQFAALQAEKAGLMRSNSALSEENQRLRIENAGLRHSQSSNPDGYVCDFCGSQNLKRSGSRPDPTFGELGVKQALFSCHDCGKQSAFTQDPP